MTHAEQYSTSEPSAPPPARRKTPRRIISTVALATGLGLASTVIASSRPASADQISDAKAQAAAITAKIQATQAQIQSLTGQVTAADYRLSQLNGQIVASQKQITKDQSRVNKDEGHLRTQAIADYTDSGTTNQVTQMFSSNVNTSGIRSEYSSIATGNVTTTVDNLHTAQTHLQATENALRQQQTQATDTRNNLQASENQASNLEAQDQSTLDSVNSHIQQLVPAAAGCAGGGGQGGGDGRLQRPGGRRTGGAGRGRSPGAQAPSGQVRRGATGGSSSARCPPPRRRHWPRVPPGRSRPRRARSASPTCGAGTPRPASTARVSSSGRTPRWASASPTTPGAQFDDTTHIPLADIEPGDLLFYGPGGDEHVAMYVGGGSMIEAPYTGASVWITGVRTGSDFAGVGRVT